MPFSNKRNSREDNSKKSRSNSENFKSKSGRSRNERPSKFTDSKSSGRSFSKSSNDSGSDSRNKYDKPFGAPKRSFDDNKGPKRFDKNNSNSSDGKRSFDKPFGSSKRSFDKSEGPKRSFDRNEGPKRSFDRNEGPKRSFDRNEGPKRSFDRNESGNFERKTFSDSRAPKSFDRKSSNSFDKKGEFDESTRPKRYERKDNPSFDKRERSYKSSFKKFNDSDDNRRPFNNKRDFSTPKDKSTENDGLIRLNRYISNSGVCSRRKADELIFEGLVSVNGEVVTELGTRVDPAKDEIRYNGERLKREKMVYVLLNKPKDYITTTDDPQERKTVMELVSKATKERIYPVGRLDRNTTGLLLLTNDGNLAEKLSHPRNSISKIYNVELDRALTQGDFNKIEYGIELEDGLIKPDDLSYVQGASKKEIGIQIHSGKNRIVRRIFESLGYEVVKLDRVVYANLTKKDLPRGRWRYLDERELIQLKHLI